MFSGFWPRLGHEKTNQLSNAYQQQIVDLVSVVKAREATVVQREETVRERQRRVEQLEQLLHTYQQQVIDLVSAIKVREATVVQREETVRERQREVRQDHRHFATAIDADDAKPLVSGPSQSLTRQNSAVSPAKALSRWRQYASNIHGMLGSQSPLDKPYVLEKKVDGVNTRLLIATIEGQDWYDKPFYPF